jgi:heat shock protein HslJ
MILARVLNQTKAGTHAMGGPFDMFMGAPGAETTEKMSSNVQECKMRITKLHPVPIALLIALLAFSACGATATPAVPTAEPTTAPPTGETGGADTLTANPWQWVSFTDPLQQFDVEMPERYLLAFSEDGTVNIVADCNNAMGSYTDEAGNLTIAVGPMTMAACPPESRSDQFVTLLGGAALYFFQDGMLYIDLFADGGTMAFAPADAELMADDGEGAMAGAFSKELSGQLDAFLQSQVYTEGGDPEGAAPGLVLLVDTPEGRYLNAAGVASIEDGTPMQVGDHLKMGSNSKSL